MKVVNMARLDYYCPEYFDKLTVCHILGSRFKFTVAHDNVFNKTCSQSGFVTEITIEPIIEEI